MLTIKSLQQNGHLISHLRNNATCFKYSKHFLHSMICGVGEEEAAPKYFNSYDEKTFTRVTFQTHIPNADAIARCHI